MSVSLSKSGWSEELCFTYRMVKCMVKLSVRHAWVWNPTARLHCDGNKIIFTIVVPSNVDVTNEYCGTKWRCSHSNDIFRSKIAIAATMWARLYFSKWVPLLESLDCHSTVQPCVRVNLLHGLHENILIEIFYIKRWIRDGYINVRAIEKGSLKHICRWKYSLTTT